MMDCIKGLADNLNAGNLVAFIGAGVSLSYKDRETGIFYQGLSGANELVRALASQKKYIDKSLPFHKACFLYKKEEGRIELEKFLSSYIDKPTLKQLPAHDLLSLLPFHRYLTTNYDELLEKAFMKNRKRIFKIIEDNDICRWDTGITPLVKLHGCVSRPKTMIAAEDEYEHFSKRAPIMEALIKTLIANKILLFLGFALEDADFKLVFEELSSSLGDNMPKSYMIVLSTDTYQRKYWESKNVKIIESDLTEFLRMLLHESCDVDFSDVVNTSDKWMNTAFFNSLMEIKTSPSETQAIDAFLKHLLDELNVEGYIFKDILRRAKEASIMLLKQKPNFEAFKKVSDIVIAMISDTKDKDEAEIELAEYLEERSMISSRIKRKWKEVISRGDNILIYSQSVRVIELLSGVPNGIQNSCHLFIAECRPKSPKSFQDAIALCESLKDTSYNITIIPDMCIANLVVRNQIDKVIMGAHTIYLKNEIPLKFINTCGTDMIITTSLAQKIPVFIIAERGKFDYTNIEDIEISYEQEESLFENDRSILNRLALQNLNVKGVNIGYDLAPFYHNVTLISEDRNYIGGEYATEEKDSTIV